METYIEPYKMAMKELEIAQTFRNFDRITAIRIVMADLDKKIKSESNEVFHY